MSSTTKHRQRIVYVGGGALDLRAVYNIGCDCPVEQLDDVVNPHGITCHRLDIVHAASCGVGR